MARPKVLMVVLVENMAAVVAEVLRVGMAANSAAVGVPALWGHPFQPFAVGTADLAAAAAPVTIMVVREQEDSAAAAGDPFTKRERLRPGHSAELVALNLTMSTFSQLYTARAVEAGPWAAQSLCAATMARPSP
jgi:hypothetical protein